MDRVKESFKDRNEYHKWVLGSNSLRFSWYYHASGFHGNYPNKNDQVDYKTDSFIEK